ncbi:MAG: AmmeMemoRadiSam system protein A [Alphaproteobacteria bacterium]
MSQLTAEQIAERHGDMMLDLVKRTLAHSLVKGAAPAVSLDTFPPELRENGATFITIEKDHKLRGCIGSLQAHRPLIQDLVENAYRAGFKDPRFPPLTREEMPRISWSISLLSEPRQMLFTGEADLLSQLKPGVDGLIIQDKGKRSTFLPQVWEQIPDPVQFLARLKQKAGLAPNHWSPDFTAFRYRVVKVG